MSITKIRHKSYDFPVMTSTYVPSTKLWTGFSRHSSSLSGSWTETRVTSDDVKDYKLLLRKHQSATTFLDGSRYYVTGGSGGRAKYLGTNRFTGVAVEGAEVEGCVTPTSALANPVQSDDYSYLDNRCLQKFASALYQAQHALQSVVCAGEFGETIRQIKHPLKALYESMFKYLGDVDKTARAIRRRATRRGGIASRAFDSLAAQRRQVVRDEVKKAVAGTYLEAVFGWIPLIRDIDSAAKAAARIIVYKPPYEFVNAFVQDAKILSPRIDIFGFGAGISIKTVAEIKSEASVKMYGITLNQTGWNGYMQDLGFDLRSFVPSLYQLLPYSFIADYFTNLGAIIEAASINHALVGWVNIGRRFSSSATVVSATPTFGTGIPSIKTEASFLPGSFPSSAYARVRRSPYVGSFIPSLEFTIPGLGMRWLNISALLAQADATSRSIRL
jgi:hypothetical protein